MPDRLEDGGARAAARTMKRLVGLCAAALSACASTPPPPPSTPAVMALPGSGKSWDDFRWDDRDCRHFARVQFDPSTVDQPSTPVQRHYDMVYQQCMYAKGNKIPMTGQPVLRPARQAAPPPPPPPGYLRPQIPPPPPRPS